MDREKRVNEGILLLSPTLPGVVLLLITLSVRMTKLACTENKYYPGEQPTAKNDNDEDDNND